MLQGLNGIKLRPLLGDHGLFVLFHIRVQLLCSQTSQANGETPPFFSTTSPDVKSTIILLKNGLPGRGCVFTIFHEVTICP